ncbi:hypothetical protein [Kribbella sp. NBC_00889]|uniref:hypothetical protein n=1 Tax=Kribbella sp. NBC_00889 TaxID=2975974 RepID=UPI00386B81E9|nr:hypothetical protein OG817_30670 [Kribbella sp. NBC_00889]
MPDPPDGLVVVLVGLGVEVWLGSGAGFRVESRLGSVLLRVGVGLLVFGRVGVAFGGVGVGLGVYAGVLGLIGVDEASSVIEGIGCSWLVGLLEPVSRSTNHPMPVSRTRAERDARMGPATPRPSDRLWFVMVCSLARGSTASLPPEPHFTKL